MKLKVFKFWIGDRVKAHGYKGTITSIEITSIPVVPKHQMRYYVAMDDWDRSMWCYEVELEKIKEKE